MAESVKVKCAAHFRKSDLSKAGALNLLNALTLNTVLHEPW